MEMYMFFFFKSIKMLELMQIHRFRSYISVSIYLSARDKAAKITQTLRHAPYILVIQQPHLIHDQAQAPQLSQKLVSILFGSFTSSDEASHCHYREFLDLLLFSIA